jgi:hypothetical protein
MVLYRLRQLCLNARIENPGFVFDRPPLSSGWLQFVTGKSELEGITSRTIERRCDMRSVPEQDWKVFKRLHHVALDRFSRQVLDETEAILKDHSKSSPDIYLAIYKLFERRDKEMADIFNDYRRSTAFLQIAMMHSRGLLTEQEFQQFSPETRNAITALQEFGRET